MEPPEVLPLYGSKTFVVQRLHLWQGDAKHTMTLYFEEGVQPIPHFNWDSCKEEKEE